MVATQAVVKKPKKVFAPVPQNDKYHAKLDVIRPLRWNDADDKGAIIRILEELSELSTDSKMRKIFKTNAKKLEENSAYPFDMEGTACKCGTVDCKRFVWNCQLSLVKSKRSFVAAHNRCILGAIQEHQRLFAVDEIVNDSIKKLHEEAQDVKREGIWDSDWEDLLEMEMEAIVKTGYNVKHNPINNPINSAEVCLSSFNPALCAHPGSLPIAGVVWWYLVDILFTIFKHLLTYRK